MTIHEFLGLLSVILTFAAYIPYLWSIWKRITTPHLFSWIIWGLSNGIVFLGQYQAGAGAGSWVAGVTCLLSVGMIALSIPFGEKDIRRSDWVALGGAGLAILLWVLTSNPLWAVILATMVDLLGFYPTIRKSFNNPYSEDLSAWSITAFRSSLSFFALEAYSATTMIFPVAMFIANGSMAAMLVWRRKIIGPRVKTAT